MTLLLVGTRRRSRKRYVPLKCLSGLANNDEAVSTALKMNCRENFKIA